jgi:hypothetical protein
MVFTGRVLNVIEINEKITQVIVQHKKGEVFFPICFTAFGKARQNVNKLVVEKKDIVKINYHIKSKKSDERYFTTVVVDDIKITKKRPLQFSFDIETGEVF